jgi:hypothetical protein
MKMCKHAFLNRFKPKTHYGCSPAFQLRSLRIYILCDFDIHLL